MVARGLAGQGSAEAANSGPTERGLVGGGLERDAGESGRRRVGTMGVLGRLRDRRPVRRTPTGREPAR
jgi:hypothetical protein